MEGAGCLMNPALRARKIRRLYDNLSRYVLLQNILTRGRPFAHLKMHKSLRPFGVRGEPAETGERPETGEPAEGEKPAESGFRFRYADDLALHLVSPVTRPRVLDIGCGFGDTVFRWYSRLGGTYTGITISNVQTRVAERQARRLRIASSCRFQTRSFESGLDGSFDIIIAIESMVHGSDPLSTLRDAVSCLSPGGRLVLIDDLPRAARAVENDRAYERLREFWGLGSVPDVGMLRRAMLDAGMHIDYEIDLASRVRLRTTRQLRQGIRLLRALYRLAPGKDLKSVVETFLGGLWLEKLYRDGLMSYLLLIARKPNDTRDGKPADRPIHKADHEPE